MSIAVIFHVEFMHIMTCVQFNSIGNLYWFGRNAIASWLIQMFQYVNAVMRHLHAIPICCPNAIIGIREYAVTSNTRLYLKWIKNKYVASNLITIEDI
jgi:hypothetical protein